MRTRRVVISLLPAVLLPIGAIAADHHHHATVQPDALKWSAPVAYAKGAQLAVVQGDPTKEGMYVVRLKVPAGFKIPAHTHPNDENVTVLSGSFNIGTGDKLDETKGLRVKLAAIHSLAKACRITRGSLKIPCFSCTGSDRKASPTSTQPTIRASSRHALHRHGWAPRSR